MQQPPSQNSPGPNGPNGRPRPAGQNVYRSGQRRKSRRKRLGITLAVMAVMLAGLFVVALLVAGRMGGEPVVSSAPQLAASSLPPASSATLPAASVVSSEPSEPEPPPREPTEWDEEAMPPLYNFENFIPEGYLDTIELIDVGGGHRMERRAGEAFLAMAEAALADGITLVRISGYRSHAEQTNNYNWSIQRYIGWGLTEEEAIERTQGWYAIPGTSEHEAGLAMDVGDANDPSTNIEETFRDTPTYEWLQAHCTEYGFILRYREEDFAITHIHSEPWHYRYVGANHAEIISEAGITLEEYVAEHGAPGGSSGDGANSGSQSGSGQGSSRQGGGQAGTPTTSGSGG